MNTAVNFKIATKLKQLGFDEKCSHYYINNFQNFKHDGKLYKTNLPNDCDNDSILQFVKRTNQPHLCNAPTIVEVVMWLYENYGIWINVHGWTNQPVDDEVWKNCFHAFVNGDNMDAAIFKTPTEAYLAGIQYALNNIVNQKPI